MPAAVRDTLLRHRSVFANKLSAARPRAELIVRKMEAEGILVKVDEVTLAVSAFLLLSKSLMATASASLPTTPASTRCWRGPCTTSRHLSVCGKE